MPSHGSSHAASPGASARTTTACTASFVMPIDHEPVLAAELVDLLAPEPGPDRRRLHLRRRRPRAPRRRSASARRDADLHRPRPRRRGALQPLRRRRSPARPASSAPTSRKGFAPCDGEGIHPDMIYMDLGMSSMQVDAWERGFSYSYDAPLDMRMDTRQEFSAADLVNEWPESRIAQVLRRFGEERYAGGIARADRPPPPAAARPPSWSPRSRPGCRPRRASAAATRPSAPSRRSGSPSTASSTRSTRRCRWPGRCCRSAAASPRSPSTRSRTGRSSSSSPTGRAAASARPSCRSASAAASPRPSC